MVNAEFLDIFGFLGFIYIIIISILILKNKKVPKWTAIILLIIGILGLTIDGLIIINTYLI